MKNLTLMVFAFTLLISCGSASDEGKPNTYTTEDGVAINGYDPVAYFEQSEARKGDPKTSSTFNGITYHFTSTKHKQLFDANPQKYLPAYGGWCAYAIAEQSFKMEPDPTLWQIQDGQLQLFFDNWTSAFTGDLKEAWNEDPEAYKTKADKNWNTITN